MDAKTAASLSTAELFARLHVRLAGTGGVHELAEIEHRVNLTWHGVRTTRQDES